MRLGRLTAAVDSALSYLLSLCSVVHSRECQRLYSEGLESCKALSTFQDVGCLLLYFMTFSPSLPHPLSPTISLVCLLPSHHLLASLLTQRFSSLSLPLQALPSRIINSVVWQIQLPGIGVCRGETRLCLSTAVRSGRAFQRPC